MPATGSTSWNFSDDEPELITSTVLLMDALRLNRRDGHGVDYVVDQCTPR